jgi:alpha-tubulin suppressor-like RCC1 family protein
MDLIEEEYLLPTTFTEKELAERGGLVIPEEAAAIIMEAQKMQQLEKPYAVKIFKKNLKVVLPIKQISAGANHILCVANTGICLAWGDNEFGQLGLGTIISRRENFISKPTVLKDLLDKKILMTAAGRNHSLFLTELSQVFSAGFNEFGQLGVKTDSMQIRINQSENKNSIISSYLYAKTKSSP